MSEPTTQFDMSEVDALTPEKREEIQQAFSFYDRDGDGKIRASELGIVIRSLGHGLFSPHFSHEKHTAFNPFRSMPCEKTPFINFLLFF